MCLKSIFTSSDNTTVTELKKQVGQRIKQARKGKGLTQREFAKMLGIIHATVNCYETGGQN